VTWTNLLANKEAQKHKTSKKELDNMRALIARDLADAGIAGLSADRRFATAYNAALQAANMAIACAGYRIMSKVGHHRVSLESTKLVLGKPMRFAPLRLPRWQTEPVPTRLDPSK
jgi:N-acyl-D-aspartate/D-glutamate deacylase